MENSKPQKEEVALAPLPNLREDIVEEAFETLACLDKCAKSKRNASYCVTMAGFCSNIITKGVMKAVGFIFKAIMDHIPGIQPEMAVQFPATMHLAFNCFSKFLIK